MNHIIGIPYKSDTGKGTTSVLSDAFGKNKDKYRITHDWISVLGYAAIDTNSIIWLDWNLVKKDYVQFQKKLVNLEESIPVILFSVEDGIPGSVIKYHENIFYLLRDGETATKINDLLARLEKYNSVKASMSMVGKKAIRPRGFGLFSGNSVKMLSLYQRIDKVAPSNFSILIKGQSGSGKELVARSIHDISNRRDEPYIAINCAAIPETLLESELFGHVKGAFTDAKESKPGKFEMADKGTIFLDEIGDMPMQLQIKLLRVLNDKIVQRVGGTTEGKKVDIRFLSATHQNLDEMISESKFRHDLFHRINVLPLSIDPLMNREDDIQLLTVDLIAGISETGVEEINKIEWSFIDRLSAIELKGNIRELKNILTRALFEAENGVLDGNLLQAIIGDKKLLDTEAIVSDEILPLWEVEKNAINKALIHYDYNISEVSRQLDISRASLYRKMEKYELNRLED